MKHSRTDDKKLCQMLEVMLSGAGIDQLAEICGSEATVYRYLNVLEDVYKVVIINKNKRYTIEMIQDESIWVKIFQEIM